MILSGEGSLRKAVCDFVEHYHRERNHPGLNKRLIMKDEFCIVSSGMLQRHQRLDGMLNYYFRQAA